jgi:hypothetical protein
MMGRSMRSCRHRAIVVAAAAQLTALVGCGTPLFVQNATNQGSPVTAQVFDQQGSITATLDFGYVSSGETRARRAKLPPNGRVTVSYTHMGGLMFAPHGHFGVDTRTAGRSWTEVPTRLEIVLGRD